MAIFIRDKKKIPFLVKKSGLTEERNYIDFDNVSYIIGFRQYLYNVVYARDCSVGKIIIDMMIRSCDKDDFLKEKDRIRSEFPKSFLDRLDLVILLGFTVYNVEVQRSRNIPVREATLKSFMYKNAILKESNVVFDDLSIKSMSYPEREALLCHIRSSREMNESESISDLIQGSSFVDEDYSVFDLEVDLSLSDKVIKEAFEKWLFSKRKERSSKENYGDGEVILSKFYSYRSIFMMDLILWEKFNKKRVSDELVGQLLFPKSPIGSEEVRKTYRPFAESFFDKNHRNFKAFMAVIASEVNENSINGKKALIIFYHFFLTYQFSMPTAATVQNIPTVCGTDQLLWSVQHGSQSRYQTHHLAAYWLQSPKPTLAIFAHRQNHDLSMVEGWAFSCAGQNLR